MPKTDRRDNTALLIEIKTELATNTTETKNIVARLDRLNGTVAEHARSISTLDQALAIHTRTLDAIAKDDDRTTTTKNSWRDWLLKGVVGIVLLLAYSLLIKAGIIADFLH